MTKHLRFLLFFLCIATQASANYTKSENDSIKINAYGDFIVYTSPYYALAWKADFPMLSYFNIESGGRSHHYMDKSLLRPGKGGCIVNNGNTSFGIIDSAIYDKRKLQYPDINFNNGKQIDCSINIIDKRSFSIDIKSNSGIDNEFFRISTAPDVSPVSIWAKKTNIPPSDQYDRKTSIYTPSIIKESYQMPAVLHFPDYGLVRIETDSKEIYLQEHIVPDYENTGLSLGPFNRGGHIWRKAVHLGSVIISFHAKNTCKEAKIKFTVLEENYPHINGCEMSDKRFDGLKRCWQNAFTLNPQNQTLGDNILLQGVGHISLPFKADLLPFTPELPSTFSMREALKNSIEIALKERIGKNNRISDFGWECTESTLIATYDYLITTNDWNFIKQNIVQIKRLVNGVLETDTDGDGIFEAPFHGNYYDPKKISWNWWDDFAFGHKDAYVNILAYRALKSTQKIFDKLNMSSDSDTIKIHLQKFMSAFHKTFYNSKTGMYAGWISQDGKMHDYQFSFINSMAINEGLVSTKLAKKILNDILKKLKKNGYDYKYGIPGPLVPVAKEDKGTWEEMTRWGRYENGGLCGQTAYHLIQALYKMNMRKEADEILFTMLDTFEKEYTHSGVFPGYLQSVDWRSKGGEPTGYNYLADNYYFLLATITGYFGIPYPELKNVQ